MAKTNIAGRFGRWSARNWKKALFGWLAFALIAMVIGSAVGNVVKDENGTGETARANTMLDRGQLTEPPVENVLVQSSTLTVKDPAFRAGLSRLVRELQASDGVTAVRTPVGLGTPGGAVSADGRSVLLVAAMNKDTAGSRIAGVESVVSRIDRENPSLQLFEFGDASANREGDAAVDQDFQRAEYLSLPVDAADPAGRLRRARRRRPAGHARLLGGAGGDRPERDDQPLATRFEHHGADGAPDRHGGRASTTRSSTCAASARSGPRGLEPRDALLRAAATSGQAVLISGVTVLIAMAGMLLAGDAIFTSIGVGDDDRRRGRDDRLADGAAGAALASSATGSRTGRDPVRSGAAASARRRRRALWARDPAAGAAPARSLRRSPSTGGAARARACPALEHAHEAAELRPTCRAASRSSRPTTRSSGASRAPRHPPSWSSRRRT